MNKFFELVFLTFFLTFASNPVFAVEDVVKNNETKLQETEIILPEDTKLPEHDVNKDGVIDDKDVIVDETEENFFMFKLLDAPIEHDENSLFGKINKALKAEVTRTDYSNYLFKDILTLDLHKGPVDRIQFYGKYRGNSVYTVEVYNK